MSQRTQAYSHADDDSEAGSESAHGKRPRTPSPPVRTAKCSTCARVLPEHGFSKRQFNTFRDDKRCTLCVAACESQGAHGLQQMFNHRHSNGLVTGALVRAPGCHVRDRARRAPAGVLARARLIVQQSWDGQFALGTTTYAQCLAMCSPRIRAHFTSTFESLAHLQPNPVPFRPELHHDFLTTLRDPPVGNSPFTQSSSISRRDSRPRGTFPDAPYLSPHHPLIFSVKQTEQHHISSIHPARIVRHAQGTVLWGEGGVLVAGRCKDSLAARWCKELLGCYFAMEKRLEFCQRGAGAASVSVGYVATAHKCDQNTHLRMPHAPRPSADDAERLVVAQFQNKLRSIYMKRIWPIVRASFGALFRPVHHLLCSVVPLPELFAQHVTGLAAGSCFWPRSHADKDMWYTIMVVLDAGGGVVRGGDFAFAELGWVLGLQHGDVLVFEPGHLHGATEAHVGSADDQRVAFAFYMKRDVVEASVCARLVEELKGRQKLHNWS